MSTVIGIAGSARRSGNSATLMRAALRGAGLAGADTKEVYLNGLVFTGCQGCQECSPKGKCILDDDLTPVLDELRQAEGWVLSSPIYFDSVSGQMKTFFDRCYCFLCHLFVLQLLIISFCAPGRSRPSRSASIQARARWPVRTRSRSPSPVPAVY